MTSQSPPAAGGYGARPVASGPPSAASLCTLLKAMPALVTFTDAKAALPFADDVLRSVLASLVCAGALIQTGPDAFVLSPCNVFGTAEPPVQSISVYIKHLVSESYWPRDVLAGCLYGACDG